MNSLSTLAGIDWGSVGYCAAAFALAIAAIFTAAGS